jgi:DNA mismatch endonuclease, patch repair protein
MADVFTPEQRSAVMRAVKSRDTSPELRVRKAAHALGLRYRLGRKDLPGNPDLAFPGRHVALFVHGCFWHGHDCARGARTPATNTAYWQAKIARNLARDARTARDLAEIGWRPEIIWECETRDGPGLDRIILDRVVERRTIR